MALTLEEKRLRRLRRAFEDAPEQEETFTAWIAARQAYLFTPEGAVMFRLEAMEFLRNARFIPPSALYADGYEAAVAFLRAATLLDRIVQLRFPAE